MQSTFTSVSNPIWADVDKLSINCSVTTEKFGLTVLPYTARGDDPDAAGRELYASIIAGNYGPVGEYVPPPSVEPPPITPPVP